MNTPIKLRGKALANNYEMIVGEWQYSESFADDGYWRGVQYFAEHVAVGNIDSETVSRWSGEVDKNGKDIYEGDVVRVAGRDEPVVVEFRDGSFGVEVMEEIQIPEDVGEGQEIFYALSDPEIRMGLDTSKQGLESIFYALEVIGSIYDEKFKQFRSLWRESKGKVPNDQVG